MVLYFENQAEQLTYERRKRIRNIVFDMVVSGFFISATLNFLFG